VARAVRQDGPHTQEELGQYVGVTGSAICRWENGQRVPRGRAALKYARWLRSRRDAKARS
jgi:DNA-binding XRE family transcriptional regulator